MNGILGVCLLFQLHFVFSSRKNFNRDRNQNFNFALLKCFCTSGLYFLNLKLTNWLCKSPFALFPRICSVNSLSVPNTCQPVTDRLREMMLQDVKKKSQLSSEHIKSEVETGALWRELLDIINQVVLSLVLPLSSPLLLLCFPPLVTNMEY